MSSIKYLIRNRAKFAITDKAFYVAWVKRLLSFPGLLTRNLKRRKLIRKGADLDGSAVIGKVKINGAFEKLKVGRNSFLGRVELALHDMVTVGNNVCINDGVVILTASHAVNDPLWPHIKSPIVIEDFAWIATNAILLPGVRVGKGAVVGAGAVVSRNVADYEIVVGNPAKPIQKKRIQDLTYNPCEFLAANLAWLKG